MALGSKCGMTVMSALAFLSTASFVLQSIASQMELSKSAASALGWVASSSPMVM
jgi:hypothetical protein